MAANATVPPLHSKRVEAWVYSVLNPLIEAFRREQLLLERGDLSWRAYSGSCEYIRTAEEYLDPAQVPNLEDFLADPLNLGFASDFSQHDDAVRRLESAAEEFYSRLMASDLFLKQVRDLLKESGAEPSRIARPSSTTITEEDLAKYVAEYLINNTKDLPAHYVTHGFWAQNRESFLRMVNEFEAYQERKSFQTLQHAAKDLKAVSGSLLRRLEEHRRYLCISFDIPAAPWTNERAESA